MDESPKSIMDSINVCTRTQHCWPNNNFNYFSHLYLRLIKIMCISKKFQLRYLQTLMLVSADNNSTIIFPLPTDLLKRFLKPCKLIIYYFFLEIIVIVIALSGCSYYEVILALIQSPEVLVSTQIFGFESFI